MHPVAEQYFALSVDEQKRVQILLCKDAYEIWRQGVERVGPISYRETVAGTRQDLDMLLPIEAIHAVEDGVDNSNVAQRYREPIVALQDDDLILSDEMQMAYYAIYNLYRFHVAGKVDDSWIIVNQALSAIGLNDAIDRFQAALKSVR